MTFRVNVLMLLLAALLGGAVAHAIDPTELPDPELQARYVALSKEFRCLQCQNESIADSPGWLASDLRREVREMLLAGKSDEEIRDFMVDRYGEFILFRPRYSARNAWLWLLPVALLLIGALVAVRVVRQRSTLLEKDDDPAADDGLAE